MASIPPILLRKLYVPGSLKNEGDLFVFCLQNQIADGTVTGLSRLVADGQDRALDDITMAVGVETRAAGDLSDDAPLAFAVGAVATVRVPGALPPGEHTIEVAVHTREIGPLVFPVIDTVS